ncbi:MAG: polysaccharide biosynthesis/export family protein [Pseudomonadota bacterium]
MKERVQHLRLNMLASLVLLAVTLCGCGYFPGMQPANQSMFDAVEQPYTLDTGDKVRVIVLGQTDLSNVYAIDQSGQISMPLIGLIDVRQVTPAELEKRIAARLGGLLREPKVTVEIETYRPFFILGEVTNSGQYPYVNGMTAQTAVAIAGGFSPRAKQSSVEVTRQVSGEVIRSTVPLYYPIRPGDTIRVHERWFQSNDGLYEAAAHSSGIARAGRRAVPSRLRFKRGAQPARASCRHHLPFRRNGCLLERTPA